MTPIVSQTPLTDRADLLAPKRPIHLNYLDGLRGLAALWVACSHLWRFQHLWEPGMLGFLTNWLSYAHLAVDTFIVLSGFCLAIPVARTETLKKGVVDFYKRRARRILPPLYACIAFSLALGLLTDRLGHGHSAPVTGATIFANVFLLQDLLPAYNTLNIPLWSVALEWKIYFFFPLLLLVKRRYGSAAALGSSAVIGYSIMALLLAKYPIKEQGLTCPWYLLLFATGMCTSLLAFRETTSQKQAYLKVGRWALLLSAAATAVLLCLYPISAQSQDVYFGKLPLIDPIAGVCVASFLFLLKASDHQGFANSVRTFLSWRPLVFIGTFSYSLYLIHLPILDIVRITVDRLPFAAHHANLQLALIALIGLPLVLVGAYVFHLLFERPFMNPKALKSDLRPDNQNKAVA